MNNTEQNLIKRLMENATKHSIPKPTFHIGNPTTKPDNHPNSPKSPEVIPLKTMDELTKLSR